MAFSPENTFKETKRQVWNLHFSVWLHSRAVLTCMSGPSGVQR